MDSSTPAATPAVLPVEDQEQCSKCQGQIDTTGYPKWCKACRAKYKREYNDTVEAMSEARGFNKGVDAFREMLAMEFARHGKVTFTGAHVSWSISNSPRPTYKTS